MQIFTDKDLAGGFEDGFKLVALQPGIDDAPLVGLRICVVTRTAPDPSAGHFVVLRETPQARVFLGCTADATSRPQEWLEIWVQRTRHFAAPGALPSAEHLTNGGWDARWRVLAQTLRQGEAASVLATPLETGHLPPAVLDPDAGRFVRLTDPANGQPLSLCTDEHLLERAGLPGYAASSYRYLYAPGGDSPEKTFIRLQQDAPTGPEVGDLGERIPVAAGAPTLGLDGGSVIIRRFAPLSLEDFSDVAGGRAWKGVDNARRLFHVPGVYRLLEDEDAMRCGSAHLFTSAQGRSGRLAEALYLKLQAFSQVLRLVRAHVQQSQLPFLNLMADSFRVRLGTTGFGLPFLWTAQTDLTRPGQAYALPLLNTAVRYFQGLEPLTASVYRPGFVGIARQGTANVRIRKVFPPTAEGIAMEGTIRSSERLSNDENDLLSIHLPLSDGNADLLGHIDFTQARSEGEAVFRTIPQMFPDRLAAALPGIEGSTYSQLGFDILSPLSTPFDLYSLGVVALRMLLAGDGNPLPEVLDRAFSLAHEADKNPGRRLRWRQRIAEAFGSDPRWRETLGWHHGLSFDGRERTPETPRYPHAFVVVGAGVAAAPVPQAAARELLQGLWRRPAPRAGKRLRPAHPRVGHSPPALARVPAGFVAAKPGNVPRHRQPEQHVLTGEIPKNAFLERQGRGVSQPRPTA